MTKRRASEGRRVLTTQTERGLICIAHNTISFNEENARGGS